MAKKFYEGDTLIGRRTQDSYQLIIVTDVNDNDEYFGDVHIIRKEGVLTHFHVNLEYDLDRSVPISPGMYDVVMKVVGWSLSKAIGLLMNNRDKPASHLEVGSCYAYLSPSGKWMVNRVLYFEEISDDTPGIHAVEVLDEEGGEVHSESFKIGNQTFDFGRTYILREDVDEDSDFLLSKKHYNRIRTMRDEMVEVIMLMLSMEDLEVKKENGKYGFYDSRRDFEIPCTWSDALPYSEGMAAVANEKGKYGFIDNLGGEVIYCRWKAAQSFSEGLAGVMDESGEWGFIDREGKLVIPCEWNTVEPFEGGKARVQGFNNNRFLIDKSGTIVEMET